MPEVLQDVVKIVVGMAAFAACIWLYLKVLTWLDLHGIAIPRNRYGDLDRPSEFEEFSLTHKLTSDGDQRTKSNRL